VYRCVIDGSGLTIELVDITCNDYELIIKNTAGVELFNDFGCGFTTVAEAQEWAAVEIDRVLHPQDYPDGSRYHPEAPPPDSTWY